MPGLAPRLAHELARLLQHEAGGLPVPPITVFPAREVRRSSRRQRHTAGAEHVVRGCCGRVAASALALAHALPRCSPQGDHTTWFGAAVLAGTSTFAEHWCVHAPTAPAPSKGINPGSYFDQSSSGDDDDEDDGDDDGDDDDDDGRRGLGARGHGAARPADLRDDGALAARSAAARGAPTAPQTDAETRAPFLSKREGTIEQEPCCMGGRWRKPRRERRP